MSEKQRVALYSVAAAVVLTVVKIVVGIYTGSLGILSEAAHSALDLGAAAVTFFAVRISDKPADEDHNYGHGKVESFSALIETALLLATCGWIIYEAVERLAFGKPMEVNGTFWGIAVMLLSIVVNISRSRSLKKAAKKYGSQALEADALHFDSDIWSSLVVIGGLVCVWIGNLLDIPALRYGDPVAALGVSVLVICVSLELGKRTIDVLLDAAPKGMIESVLHEANGVNGVLEVRNVRVRPSGPNYFVDLSIGINRNESHRAVHSIVHKVKDRLQEKIPNSDVVVSTFPVDVTGVPDLEVYHTVKKIVDTFPACTNIHNIHVYEVSNEKYVAVHLEVKENMDLHTSHKLSHEISELVQAAMSDIKEVSVNFECVRQLHVSAEDITDRSAEVVTAIGDIVNTDPENLSCHDIKLYSEGQKMIVFLHCEVSGNTTTEKIEEISDMITEKIKRCIAGIGKVHIHVEPMGE